MQSLGSVLTGALPLILMDRNQLDINVLDEDVSTVDHSPVGARRIIRTVRRHATRLLHDPDIAGPKKARPADAAHRPR